MTLPQRNQAPPGGWQPIETAPKDGTRVDGWAIHTPTGGSIGRVTDVWWENDVWWQGRPDQCWDIEAPIYTKTGIPVVKLTHWMPLPAPPGAT